MTRLYLYRFNTPRYVFPAFVLLLWCAFSGAAIAEANNSLQHKPLKVVATFSILADWARVIGGDRVNVYSLVKADEDAHVYRVSPRDVREVKQADLLIVNGLGYEGWLDRLVASSGYAGQPLIASRGVAYLRNDSGHDHNHSEHAHHGHHAHGDHQDSGGEAHHDAAIDPHAWHSIAAAKVYTRNIAQALIKRDPEHAGMYQRALDDYHSALNQLYEGFQRIFRAIPRDRRQVVVPHDSFAYLGREFGVRFHALQGTSTKSEASAQDLARIVRQIREQGIHALFLENVSNPRLIHQIQSETGARIGGELISDALSKGRAESYLALMEHNLSRLAEALRAPE